MGDWIEVGAFKFPCILGVLDREQRDPQTLEVDLRLGLDLGPAGDTGDLGRTVNYANVVDQVTFLCQQGRFRLLETMAQGICRLLLAPPSPQEDRSPIDAVEVALRKPEVLMGRATPGIRVLRRAPMDIETRVIGTGVTADVLVETQKGGAYRIHVAPGARCELPEDFAFQVLAGTVRHGADTLLAGREVPAHVGGPIKNVGRQPISLLAVVVLAARTEGRPTDGW